MNHDDKPISAGLYLISTPIGAARDITLRALDLLRGVDLIAAEDTRTARKLMEIHGVALGDRKVVAYHDHSSEAARNGLVAAVAAGKSVAFLSEAGTPLIADPGLQLARAAIGQGLAVTAAPGASAVLAALTVAGLPTDRFAFIGFLPAAEAARDRELMALAQIPMTLVFYESPKRLAASLAAMSERLGPDRPAAVCRELTKKFEETRRGSLGELASGAAEGAARGEHVIVVGYLDDTPPGEDEVRTALEEALRTMRVKDAATAVAGALNLPRRTVYQLALKMGSERD